MSAAKKHSMKIRIYGDPVLAQKAKPIEKVTSETLDLGDHMIEAMRKGDGVGLAGNQIGLPLRIFALEVPMPKDQAFPLSPGERELLPKMPLVLINPEIVSYGKVVETREEGCLSVPGIYAAVERPMSVVLKAQILGGATVTLDCGGLLGRAIQHEVDHLDGVVFVDRLSEEEYKKIKSKLDKLVKSAGRKSVIRRIVGALKG